MRRFSFLPLSACLLLTPLSAQDGRTGFVPGLDVEGQLDTWFMELQSGSTTVVSVATNACNPGSVVVHWEAAPDPDHPFIGVGYYRLHADRFEQISNWSFVKHGTFSTNQNGCGGGCQVVPTNRLGLNCSDAYGAPANWNRPLLGPPDEIDPFTGTWTMFGSHMDVGYPPRVPDGIVSWINTPDDASFRVNIPNSFVGTPGARYFAMSYYVVQWEPAENRENNMSHREIDLSASNTVSLSERASGTVLQRWPGARVESAANIVAGTPKDGRFYVGAKVIPLADGWYRYEYAVHNRDNHGAHAQFRVPFCPSGRHRNAGMKGVPLGNRVDRADVGAAPIWTIARQGDELVFDAPAEGAQPWNTVFNFWFEADAAPADGDVELVQAQPNPGAATAVVVASDVPLRQTNTTLGGACSTSAPLQLWPSAGASIPNPAFGLGVRGAAADSRVALSIAFAPQTTPLGVGGCTLLSAAVTLARTANASGAAEFRIAIPSDPTLEGISMYCQALEARLGGAILGLADASDVVRVQIGNTIAACR